MGTAGAVERATWVAKLPTQRVDGGQLWGLLVLCSVQLERSKVPRCTRGLGSILVFSLVRSLSASRNLSSSSDEPIYFPGIAT